MVRNRIAVSKLSTNYGNWLKNIDSTAVVIDLYEMEPDEAVEVSRRSAGLLLTGGGDINPSRYSRESYLQYCRGIDEKRDELELLLVRVAVEAGIPILGICRGLQMLNVAFGGTLIPDIPEFLKTNIPHSGEQDVYHRVNIREKSRFFELTGIADGIVNSSHHQCIDKVATDLIPVAFSPDNIIEAVEADKKIHPFCLAVQWHPERMEISNALSWKVGVKFLESGKQ